MSARLRRALVDAGGALVFPLIAIAISFVLGAFIVLATGNNPLTAYAALVRGAVGSPTAIGRTLLGATPLIFTGLAVAVENTEYFGADSVVSCRLGDQRIVVRSPGRPPLRQGDAARITWPNAETHFFDATSGTRREPPQQSGTHDAQPGETGRTQWLQ